jgi:hypothetical protein
VKETIPSLAELGGHQLYPADPSIGMDINFFSPEPDIQRLIKTAVPLF